MPSRKRRIVKKGYNFKSALYNVNILQITFSDTWIFAVQIDISSLSHGLWLRADCHPVTSKHGVNSCLRRKVQGENCNVFLAFPAPTNPEAVKAAELFLVVSGEGDRSLDAGTGRRHSGLRRTTSTDTKGSPSLFPSVWRSRK